MKTGMDRHGGALIHGEEDKPPDKKGVVKINRNSLKDKVRMKPSALMDHMPPTSHLLVKEDLQVNHSSSQVDLNMGNLPKSVGEEDNFMSVYEKRISQ